MPPGIRGYRVSRYESSMTPTLRMMVAVTSTYPSASPDIMT